MESIISDYKGRLLLLISQLVLYIEKINALIEKCNMATPVIHVESKQFWNSFQTGVIKYNIDTLHSDF